MRLKELIARQQALLEGAKAESRDLNAGEQKEFDALQKEIDKLKATSQKEDDLQKAVAAERQRTSEIMTLCRNFDLDPQGYIDAGKSIEEVRAAILDDLAKQKAPITRSKAGDGVTEDEEDKFRAEAELGLRQRMGMDTDKGRSSFAGTRLRDLAAECLEREDVSAHELRRMSDDDLLKEVCKRAMFNPTDAFPAILDNTVNKTIADIYQLTPATFNLWTTSGSLSDFKQENVHQWEVGGVSDFEKVAENGELKADKPAEKLLPTRKLDTYGKSFSLTRQAFINDDIGYLARALREYAAAAKTTIDNQVYDMLLNGSYADGKTIFHKDHGNLAITGAKPGQDGLQAAFLAMGSQKDDFGKHIRVVPKFVLIGNANQFDTYVALHSAQTTGSANNDVNPMYNRAVQPIIVPQLDDAASSGATPWVLVADPLTAKSIEVDYLDGNQTPQVRRMEKPGVLGFHWDVFLDWGITALDYRGVYKNGGAK